MTRRRTALWLLFGLAALLRLHNAVSAPALSGFDGPFHAAYVGIVHDELRLPLPEESWSTYHPPFYYSASAALWWLLPDGLPPLAVLFALRCLNVFAGLSIGWILLLCARRLVPDRPDVGVYAAAIAWFLPMHVGPSSLIGNEIFAAALCAAAFGWVLPMLEEPPSLRRGAGLGALLGLALMSKLNAAAMAVAVGLALLRRAATAGRDGPVFARACVAAIVVAILVSGGWFGRNLLHYGTPVLMEVEQSASVMEAHGYGQVRPIASYLSLSPGLIVDPSARSDDALEAVWPVTFASVWFDVHGSLVDPAKPWSKPFARVLFLVGAALTLAGVVGAVAVARGRVHLAAPGARFLLFSLVAVSLVAYVFFTRQVATFSTLKGTLLSPGVPAFTLLAAIGCDRIAANGAGARRAIAGLIAVEALACATILWSGGLAPTVPSPATLYLGVYSDPATVRVYRYFEVRGRRVVPARPDPAAPSPKPALCFRLP